MAAGSARLERLHWIGIALLILAYVACAVLGGRGVFGRFTETSPYFILALVSAAVLTLIVKPWRR